MPLPFDSLTLCAVCAELHAALLHGTVEQVAQPAPLDIVIRVFGNGAARYLLLSADPQTARVHLTVVRRDSPPVPPRFCAALRKHLLSATVQSVTLPFGLGERTLRVTFQTPEGTDYNLYAETQGPRSNLVLTNADGQIIDSAKRVGKSVNRVRQTLPGLPYAAPPPQTTAHGEPRRDPFAPFHAEHGAEPFASLSAAKAFLLDTWAGVSPLLAKEVLLRAQETPTPQEAPPAPQIWGEDVLQSGVRSTVPARDGAKQNKLDGTSSPQTWGAGGAFLSVLTPQSLHRFLQDALAPVQTGNWQPRIWTSERGETVGAYPITLFSVPAAQQHARDSISLALDNAASSLLQKQGLDDARAALLTLLDRAEKRRERERLDLDDALQNAARADQFQQTGELLLAAPHLFVEKADTVSVPDWYADINADGQTPTRTIPVDPALTPHENAERWFTRARKARAAQGVLASRRDAAVDELLRLSAARQQTTNAVRAGQVGVARAAVQGLLAREVPSPTTGKRNAPPAWDGHHIRAFQSPDGWEVLVGEDAAANDFLTGKVARPGDVWLHARQAASAHAVVRVQGVGKPVSQAALLYAAGLVAARSASKHASLVPVDYTFKKYVRKPRGSAPGAALYDHEKTLHVSGIHG